MTLSAMDIALGEVFTGVFSVRTSSIQSLLTPGLIMTDADVRRALGAPARCGRDGVRPPLALAPRRGLRAADLLLQRGPPERSYLLSLNPPYKKN